MPRLITKNLSLAICLLAFGLSLIGCPEGSIISPIVNDDVEVWVNETGEAYNSYTSMPPNSTTHVLIEFDDDAIGDFNSHFSETSEFNLELLQGDDGGHFLMDFVYDYDGEHHWSGDSYHYISYDGERYGVADPGDVFEVKIQNPTGDDYYLLVIVTALGVNGAQDNP